MAKIAQKMNAARYIYFTNNVGPMVAFYRDVMGMAVLQPPKAMNYDTADWVQLSSGNMEVAIHRAGNPGCSGRNRNKLVFVVRDVAAARAGIESKGVKVGKHHVASAFECCDFSDPDGNVIQISSR